MRWPARKAVRWLLLALAVILATVIGAAAWLLTTEAGLGRVVSIAESLDAAEIRVEGAEGRLIGPLRISRLDIVHPRATIRIADFEADYEPLEILAGRISAEGVRVDDAEVRMQPRAGPPREPAFMPRWLTLVLKDAAVTRLLIVSPRGSELRLRDIRGSVTLTRSEIEFDGAYLAAPAWEIAGASGSLHARTPLGLDVTTAWSLGGDRRVTGIARLEGNFDRAVVDAEVATPGSAQIVANLRDLTGDLQWDGKAELARLDLAQWLEEPPFGHLRGTFSLHGDRERYFVAGTVRGEGLPESGVRVDGAAHYADRLVSIPELTLDAADLAVQLQGTMTVAEEPGYDMRASWSAFRWPLTGQALVRSSRGTLEAQGWREFDYRMTGNFVPAGGPPFAGSASGRFTTTEIVVEDSDWSALGGRVAARGTLAREPPRAWTVAGRATGIDPSRIREGLAGRLGFQFAASGSGFGEDAPVEASVRNLSGSFRGQPASGSGTVRRDQSRLEFEDVALSLGPARLALDGTWGRGARLDARLVADDLSAFLPELGGHVNATVEVRDRTIAVAFTGHDLAFGSHSAVILSVDAHVDRDGRKHSWLRLRSTGLTVAGFPLTDTRLSLDGLVHDHAMGFRVGAGEDAVMLRGRGAWKDDRYALALETLAAGGPRIAPWRLESPAHATAGEEAAGLEPFCLIYDDRRVCLEGDWQRGRGWSVKARTESFPLEVLDSDAPGRPRYRGQLIADANASGSPGEPWRADVRAEIRGAALLYKSASGAERTVELGLTRLSLQSDSGRHRLELRVSESAALQLAVALEATRIADRSFGELPIRGTVSGSTRQTGLLPLFVEAIDDASGELALDFNVAGRMGAPLLEGTARLSGGSLDIYQANLRLREVEATMRLQETSLDLDAEAKVGEGSLEIDGRLGWRDRRLNGRLAMKGERLLVANVPEARVLASPDLRFVLDDRRIDITGTVEIPEARIVPADTAGAVLVSSDETIVRAEALPDAGEGFDVRTDIRLSLGKKVEIDAYGLSGTVTGSVRAQTGPHEGTLATGELEVVDGEYSAYTRELEVERGRLVFTGGPVTDPGVDLRASRRLAEYRVGVIARGPLRRPQLTLFSEPPLPQSHIASMLVVGRASLQAGDGDAESATLTEQGGALLAGQLGSQVGLDDVGISQDPSAGASLVIGKYLSPRLYVSYGISLVDQINTLKLRYTIGDRWVISAESGAESATDIEYRIED